MHNKRSVRRASVGHCRAVDPEADRLEWPTMDQPWIALTYVSLGLALAAGAMSYPCAGSPGTWVVSGTTRASHAWSFVAVARIYRFLS